MLQELRVNNLALIDELELDFTETSTGLLVFTGETGAGKSIILQAVHLLTGGRASQSWVRSDCDQAVIEALFDISGHLELADLLQEHGFDSGDDCIMRRIVNSRGRSRIFINDRLATTRLASELAENLVNIASQHDHQQLLRSSSHIDFLDGYGELLDIRREYGFLFASWQKLRRSLRKLQEREQGKEQLRDFLSFQLREIRDAEPLPGEDDQLVRERDLLKSSTTLAELAGRSHNLLQNQLLVHLVEIRKNMEQAAALDPGVKELAERISSACFEVEDLEGALRSYRSSIPMDQGRLDTIASRLAQLRQLQRKYGSTLTEVLAFADQAEEELATLDSLEQEIITLKKELQEIKTKLLLSAGELSKSRCQVADRLTEAMQEELASLSFSQAVFEVSISGTDDPGALKLSATGQDTVEFLFSANPGEPPKPLVNVVSGGELSRLMLAMKCLLARRDKVDTVIFDEIDAGIGGEAAEAVARKIAELAGHHQVFCITHLPQIAAHADTHFLVDKEVNDNRTHTTIRCLDREERVAELARMLGGDNPSEQTLGLAKELVERKSA
ncbi:MAG: DNA repair protein RecN [Deltaproteobacteria bacterium]|nr:DNA repair protein RecN [Deltaproteobacteria bacterium]